MKKIIIGFAILLFGVFQAKSQGTPFPYPATTPADIADGYEIVSAGGGINDIDWTGSTWAWIPYCDNLNTSFNFNFPNRDPNGDSPTRMKFTVYEQNWITGAFTSVYSSPGWWLFPASTSATLYFPMAPNGISIPIQPFHLYYIHVKAQRKRQIAGIEFWWIGSQRSGYTQTVNIGPCNNRCRTWGPLILGNLPSSAANQIAGLYNPLYDTDHYIESTTHLSSGEQLILDAGEYVQLKPGFRADYGSDFIAYIDGCGGRTSRVITPEATAQNDQKYELMKDPFEVNVYPNPNDGSFNVAINSDDDINNVQIQIMDLMGKVVYSNNSNDSSLRIDISNQPKGIYLVQIISNGKSTVKKVMVQ